MSALNTHAYVQERGGIHIRCVDLESRSDKESLESLDLHRRYPPELSVMTSTKFSLGDCSRIINDFGDRRCTIPCIHP